MVWTGEWSWELGLVIEREQSGWSVIFRLHYNGSGTAGNLCGLYLTSSFCSLFPIPLQHHETARTQVPDTLIPVHRLSAVLPWASQLTSLDFSFPLLSNRGNTKNHHSN